MNYLIIGFAVGIVILIIIIAAFALSSPAKKSPTSPPPPTTTATPPITTTQPPPTTTTQPPVTTSPPVVTDTTSRATNIPDCGYSAMQRGWYNVLNPAFPPFNDYCRYVGDPPKFMCVTAADKSNQYTVPSLGDALSTAKYPFQALAKGDTCYVDVAPATTATRPTNIPDCGYKEMQRGWYNMLNPGTWPFNDYCRYVGDPPKFMCATATDQYAIPTLGDALSTAKYPFQALKSGDTCYVEPSTITTTRPTNIPDCGYSAMQRGWYNIVNPFLPPFNDYCRYVGDPPKFMCVTAANPTNQYTVPAFGDALSTAKYPFQKLIAGDACYAK